MPITNRFFIGTTLALILAGFVVLVGIVAMTIWLGERSSTFFDAISEARDSRAAAIDLRGALQDAEASQRGFLLTGREEYLAPYNLAVPVITPRYEALKANLEAYPETAGAVARLKQAIDLKLAEMDRTITLKREGHDAEALAIINTDEGKDLMEEARLFLSTIIRSADERVSDGVTVQRANARALRWVSIVGGIVIVLVIAGAAFTVLRYAREINRARDEVAAANASLEERVRERTVDLGRANEEIQRFAYIVTHDLRAPLVNIMGFTSELENDLKPIQAFLAEAAEGSEDEAAREANEAATRGLPESIGFIRSSTRKMDGLINAILRLSREGRRTLRPETVNIADLVSAATGAVQHQILEADGTVDVSIAIPPIVSDRLSLEQVLGNLIDNAVKYRAPDRPLRLTVRGHVESGNRVVVEIADNGRGIATQDLERVFELFRRSGSQDQPGEGIGLAFVRTVVRNLGGDISVTSAPGQGTTFKVSLPRNLQQVLGSRAA